MYHARCTIQVYSQAHFIDWYSWAAGRETQNVNYWWPDFYPSSIFWIKTIRKKTFLDFNSPWILKCSLEKWVNNVIRRLKNFEHVLNIDKKSWRKRCRKVSKMCELRRPSYSLSYLGLWLFDGSPLQINEKGLITFIVNILE